MLSLNTQPSSPHELGKRPRDEIGPFSKEAGGDAEGDLGFRIDRSSTPLSQDAPRIIEPFATPSIKRARLSKALDRRASSPMTSTGSFLQLPPNASQLLDMYFATTHTWLPIVAKHNILRASYLYANAPSISVARLSLGSGDHATLWALLSYSVSVSQSYPDNTSLGSSLPTMKYYEIARSLIPSETEHYELGHVQALLLLTLVNVGLENWTAAWMLSGQAVRAIISMDIGVFSDARKTDEFRQMKAVYLGCFVIDSMLSFRLSRRPSMHPRDVVSVGLLDEHGLEEWNSWADVLPPTSSLQSNNTPRQGPLLSLSCFNRMVELASVMNKICRESAVPSNAFRLAQQLVSELKHWDDCLPLGCRLIGPESIYPERHSALLPHQTYLGLIYVATLLLLYLQIAPQELSMHRSRRPATEGAKKLLYRALPLISQHIDNFRVCSLPPIFELSLRTIAEQAFILRDKIESDLFPFQRWSEALIQRTSELSAGWPVYRTLSTNIEQWYRSRNASTLPSQSKLRDTDDGPRGISDRLDYNRRHSSLLSMTAAEHRSLESDALLPPISRQNTIDVPEADYTSSILGIPMPVDGQYVTPKGARLENSDSPLQLQSFSQPHNANVSPPIMDASDPANELDAMLQGPSNSQAPTQDSSVSNRMTSEASAVGVATNASMASALNDHGSSDHQVLGGSNASLDAIFKDLAYLDTTEWATSREAGLKDFGFLDDTTFQEFCHDPDRLAGSQPLVHPPSIADIWPPPGFFPETFQGSSEDSMEA